MAIVVQRFIRLAFRKFKTEEEDGEPSTYQLLLGVINWVIIILALLLCFYAIPSARSLLDTELRYLLTIVAVIILTIFFQRLVRYGLGRYLQKSAQNLKVDPTAFNFLKNAINAIILLISFFFIFYSIPALRAVGTTLLASAGIVAAVAAFASQHALANIVSGVFIVIFKPFRVDDMIKIGVDITGKVEDITLRHTVIRNFENRRVIIPNSTVNAETIINSNLIEEKICVHLEIGISYDSDIDRAMAIMRSVSERHPMCIDNRDAAAIAENRPIAIVRVLALADSSVILRAWAWAQNADDAFVMKCDLLKQVKEEFDRQGIEIPFPHLTLVYKKDV
ncbi:mechanosensitive ion channel family protein, partial [candidate division KSB1 bacterium]